MLRKHYSPCLFLIEVICDENAVSNVINGVTECFCKLGYHGNGLTCTGMLMVSICRYSISSLNIISYLVFYFLYLVYFLNTDLDFLMKDRPVN